MEEAKGSVLFIEADADTCDLIATMLKYAGYQTVIASTVRDGVQLARDRYFDIILLDWWFEDGTGVEVCRRIREFDSHTPVLFYTGITYKPNLTEGMEAGAQGYFMQPTDLEELLLSYSKEHRSKNTN